MLERVARKIQGEGVSGLVHAVWRIGKIRLLTMFKRGPERYATMQRAYYRDFRADDAAALRDVVVGNYDAHERYPYEQYLLRDLDDPGERVALDFGCGPGRMILRMARRLRRVDGVDISPSIVDACRAWTAVLPNPPMLFVNDGLTLSDIASDSYDLVYTTVSFHHIAVYDVRFGLLKEFRRVLHRGGRLALQMIYTDQPRERWAQHVEWLDNPYQVRGTNSQCDVRITPGNLTAVRDSFEAAGFEAFEHELAPLAHPMDDATHWIFLYARAR